MNNSITVTTNKLEIITGTVEKSHTSSLGTFTFETVKLKTSNSRVFYLFRKFANYNKPNQRIVFETVIPNEIVQYILNNEGGF